jgi:hypothetical protein
MGRLPKSDLQTLLNNFDELIVRAISILAVLMLMCLL